MAKTIEITTEEYEALESAGVDNWEGFEYAMEEIE